MHIAFHASYVLHDTAPTGPDSLSLHDALPISIDMELLQPEQCVAQQERSHFVTAVVEDQRAPVLVLALARSEEHTSELQSPCNLVCRLLLEKKKRQKS